MKVIRLLAASALFLFAIPGGLLIVGRGLDAYVFPFPLPELAHLIGVSVFLAGFMIGATSIWQLYSYGSGMPRGDVVEEHQSSRLVTRGLYGYTRNPMLPGSGLVFSGVGLYFGSFSMAFVLSPLFVAVVSLWIKKKEEPKLVKRFGQEYLEYREKTPFLIPRIRKED